MAYVKRTFAIIAVLLIALYVADYASLKFRIPGNRQPFGSVQVRRSYAVKQKNGKLEYYFDAPEDQACVHSLFPHSGDQPCWYLSRHATVRIEL